MIPAASERPKGLPGLGIRPIPAISPLNSSTTGDDDRRKYSGGRYDTFTLLPRAYGEYPLMTKLKLVALDEEDLAVLSAQLQDAVVKVADLAYEPRGRRFAAMLNRFDWLETATSEPKGVLSKIPFLRGRKKRRYMRRRTGLRIERVEAARLQGVDMTDKDTVMSLLAVQFTAKEPPSGVVSLLFSGGAAIELDVECIEAEMRDFDAAWTTARKPRHEASRRGDEVDHDGADGGNGD